MSSAPTRKLLDAALADVAQARQGVTVEPGETSLEDVFIQFMAGVAGQHGMNAVFSFARLGALLIKEFIQMRRDRITFAMMLGVPLMQLVLFGFAINTDPKACRRRWWRRATTTTPAPWSRRWRRPAITASTMSPRAPRRPRR